MSTDQPNILLIMTDQQRLSAVGAYGSTPCQTPRIDQLASEGVRFETAYTTCPVCTPARASVMTGQYPHSHGMIQNIEDAGTPVHELPDTPHLLSRRLASAGYQLGYTGKWHLGSDEKQKLFTPIASCLPKDVGFTGQNFPGHGDGGWDYAEFRTYLRHRGFEHKVKPWQESATPCRPNNGMGELEQPEEGTVPYFLTDHTLSLLDQFTENNPDKPFFIWHNYWGPHEPYYPTSKYLQMYQDIPIPQWPNYHWPAQDIPGPHQMSITPQLLWHDKQLTWDDWAMAIRYYYAFTTMIDDQIGRIVNHLRHKNILENTVIIFASDHGESLGDHGGIYNKGWTHFEETHRIPFIIRMPDGTGSGKVVKELTSLIDLYPTILDLAGKSCTVIGNPPTGRPANWPYDCNHQADGMSLLPLIRSEQIYWRDTVVSEFNGLYDNNCIMRTLRHSHYKYGYTFLGKDELYDLSTDPHEMTNLIDNPTYADIAKNLCARLRQWMIQTQDQAQGGFNATRWRGNNDLLA